MLLLIDKERIYIKLDGSKDFISKYVEKEIEDKINLKTKKRIGSIRKKYHCSSKEIEIL